MMQFDANTDYSLLKDQEEYWEREVRNVMEALHLDKFPTANEFNKCGKIHIMNDIQQNCGLTLFSELCNIDHVQFHHWKRIIFDIMDARYINWYPEESHWVAMGKKVCYDKIQNTIGHEVLKERFGLLSRWEYLRATKK